MRRATDFKRQTKHKWNSWNVDVDANVKASNRLNVSIPDPMSRLNKYLATASAENKKILIGANCSPHLRNFFSKKYKEAQHVFDVVDSQKFDGDIYHYALKHDFNAIVTNQASQNKTLNLCAVANTMFADPEMIYAYYIIKNKDPLGVILLPENEAFKNILSLVGRKDEEIFKYLAKTPAEILDLR